MNSPENPPHPEPNPERLLVEVTDLRDPELSFCLAVVNLANALKLPDRKAACALRYLSDRYYAAANTAPP